MEIKQTERGWPGHFCCSERCVFHRNTLLQYGETRIVVSTVGDFLINPSDRDYTTLGGGRYYETMIFHAENTGTPWDADVTREITISLPTSVFEQFAVNAPDIMHNNAVEEIKKGLLLNVKF